MLYNTFESDSELRPLIKAYWILEDVAHEHPEKQRIIPDGCMEMIFHIGDLYRQYVQDGNYILQPRCFVFGQITSPLDIEPTGVTNIFAVRFYPETFSAFSTMPVNDMENRAVSLNELFGEEGTKLQTEILNAGNTESRMKICESFLLSKLTRQETVDRVVSSGVELMLGVNGRLPIGELAQQMKINRRQLERKFTAAIGLSPKQLSKIIRLQATIKLLLSNRFASLSEIAHEGDYYDQAHFIKDFKEFTGMSPKKFYVDNLKMSAIFISDE